MNCSRFARNQGRLFSNFRPTHETKHFVFLRPAAETAAHYARDAVLRFEAEIPPLIPDLLQLPTLSRNLIFKPTDLRAYRPQRVFLRGHRGPCSRYTPG